MLYHGDCMDYMAQIETGFFDMTFTSPPFKDADVEDDYWLLYARWMAEIFRVTRNVAVIINSANRLNEIVRTWPAKRMMIWGKGISQYSWRWNPIFVYQLSESYKVNKYIWCDTFGVESVQGKWKVHKYQDPVLLYQTIIKMFNDCDSVFDPFAGSCTTAIACKELGRTFYGCEISYDNWIVANNRIANYEPLLVYGEQVGLYMQGG